MKNIFLIVLTLFITVSSFSQQKVTATLVHNNPADTLYPITTDTTGVGGYRVVQNIVNRDLIPMAYRKFGMLVYVQNTDSIYQLKSANLDNSNWFAFKAGSVDLSTLVKYSDTTNLISTKKNLSDTSLVIRGLLGGKVDSTRFIDSIAALQGRKVDKSQYTVDSTINAVNLLAKKNANDSTNSISGYTTLYQNSLKQNKLTNPITGTGTSGYLPVWDSTSTLTNSSGTGLVRATAGVVSYDNTSYQQLNSELSAFAALTNSSGFVKKISSGSYSLDNSTYLTQNQTINLTGDLSGSGTTAITGTLATVNANVGTFGSATQVAVHTVNAKGLITAASNVTITPAWSSITSKPTTVSGYNITDALEYNTNKATSFATLNNTLYPTTQAVDYYYRSKISGMIAKSIADTVVVKDKDTLKYVTTATIPYGNSVQVYSVGNPYNLTTTFAPITFTDIISPATTHINPTVTIYAAGTWKISTTIFLTYNIATIASTTYTQFKLSRTNNTAVDLANAITPNIYTGVMTTNTSTICIVIPDVLYSTTNTSDIITIEGMIGILPVSGYVQVISASINAEQIF